jgi:thioesterase domain-containing protein/acyl carrier protein
MTETCAAAVYSQDFPDHDAKNAFAAVGFAMPGLQIRVGSDGVGELPAGSVGELQVCGGPVFDRYYNSPEVTRAAFTQDGWFHTGDLARIEQGRLTLLGRSKDCIIVSGVNYFSQDLEAELEKLEGVDRSFVAAFPIRKDGADTEQLVIAFAPAFPVEEDARLLKLCVSIRNTTIVILGFRPAAIIPLAHTTFPKTNLGKIQRSLMRKRFEAGDYASQLACMVKLNEKLLGPHAEPQNSVEEDLVKLFAELFDMRVEEISATANFFDLGGTSIDILRLTRMLYSKFGFNATLTTVIQHQTVRQLAREISFGIKGNGHYNPVVNLQVTGSNTPLFLVHPGDGGVLVFVSVAKYFADERPVYALRAPGFDLNEDCLNSFEEIVRTYVGAIRARQPRGPYVIAGYSMGGSIAFEIAKELVDVGERIAFLGCIDGQPCGTETDADFAATLQGASALLNLVDARHLSSWARVASSLHAASRRYVMRGTVDSMVVFESSGLSPGAGSADWSTRLRAWDLYVAHPKFVRVSGDHNSLLSPNHSISFQAALREEIQKAERSCGSATQGTELG